MNVCPNGHKFDKVSMDCPKCGGTGRGRLIHHCFDCGEVRNPCEQCSGSGNAITKGQSCPECGMKPLPPERQSWRTL